MLEDEQSLQSLDEIINHPALDVVYLGIYDLAASLGLGHDIQNPRVRELVAGAIKKIIQAKKAAGCMAHSRQELEYYKNLGVTFLVYKVDASVLYDAYKEAKGNLIASIGDDLEKGFPNSFHQIEEWNELVVNIASKIKTKIENKF